MQSFWRRRVAEGVVGRMGGGGGKFCTDRMFMGEIERRDEKSFLPWPEWPFAGSWETEFPLGGRMSGGQLCPHLGGWVGESHLSLGQSNSIGSDGERKQNCERESGKGRAEDRG